MLFLFQYLYAICHGCRFFPAFFWSALAHMYFYFMESGADLLPCALDSDFMELCVLWKQFSFSGCQNANDVLSYSANMPAITCNLPGALIADLQQLGLEKSTNSGISCSWLRSRHKKFRLLQREGLTLTGCFPRFSSLYLAKDLCPRSLIVHYIFPVPGQSLPILGSLLFPYSAERVPHTAGFRKA